MKNIIISEKFMLNMMNQFIRKNERFIMEAREEEVKEFDTFFLIVGLKVLASGKAKLRSFNHISTEDKRLKKHREFFHATICCGEEISLRDKKGLSSYLSNLFFEKRTEMIRYLTSKPAEWAEVREDYEVFSRPYK